MRGRGAALGAIGLGLALGLGEAAGAGGPIRPLAQEHVVVGESPSPADMPLYSPTILRLDDHRLVAGYTRATKDTKRQGPGAEVAKAPRRTMSPIGWVEPAVVQIVDPDHGWHDPSGRTFHLLARAHTGGTGLACLTKVVENADGSMTMSLERAPSGKTMLYVPMPGGQMRFHVLYDARTRLYWLLGSQATDSMRRPDRLPAERYDLPNNERHRLVLHFSRNLIDWCFAGLVAKTESPKEARSYASMDIDGDDLVILSRSGDARAKSAHDGNLITFHRVRNFRTLVY